MIDKRDTMFIALIMFGIAALIILTMRKPQQGEVFASVSVPNDTEIVGMSLSPESNPPDASPFKGRYVVPPPLMGMNPSTTADATEGVATAQKVYH